jgi:hypothetical protein
MLSAFSALFIDLKQLGSFAAELSFAAMAIAMVHTGQKPHGRAKWLWYAGWSALAFSAVFTLALFAIWVVERGAR